MLPDIITISSRIDTKLFTDFAFFDTLIRQKRLRAPALFSGIFLIFALICFAMNGKAEQAVLLGAVMLAIAIVLPAAYFGMFFLSVRQKAKELKLDQPHLTYTINMTGAADGITINAADNKGGTLRVRWEHVHHAYRTKSCIYFYVSARQAFLLPDNQANVTPDELWDYLKQKLSDSQYSDRRKK